MTLFDAGRRLLSKCRPPGLGPEGKTCRTCRHYTRVQGGARAYPKCGLMRHRWTGGKGSDIRAGDPACASYEDGN